MSESLRTLPIWTIFVVITILLLVSTEIGNRLGVFARNRAGAHKPADIGTLLGSVLGMLALLLGFTFAMAASRYEQRRELVVKDANAIGTAYLRSRLLPEPQRTEIATLFRSYTDAKLEIVDSMSDQARIEKLLEEIEQSQNRMWAAGSEVAATAQNPIYTNSFLQALNEVIDVHGERIAALRARIPASIFMVGLIVGLFAMLLTGYSAGLNESRNVVATTLACLLIALVMMLIVDLHRPHEGTISISQQSMLDLRDWLGRQAP
ncbi:MAG TPA: hypothetical protein PLF26_16130 [Blastocatellia bacterium]|nr:hypothetical protein [Blastocatellia bacterium]